ncbi:hypothetical protein E3N88_21317 [Mikania micrantha]|uniref:Pentacotripeptide-repeat region of PRORP domain-containing protein n=1 Tax=Mikania micrantha TaxID=192012 RepID=A0A5N6NJX3_9ASTR|nr:hypothetical protein E3N88_21317 [Mikania micrantha]
MSKTLLSRITPRNSCNSQSPSKIPSRIKKLVIELCNILTTRNTNWEEAIETRLSEEEIVPSDIAHQVFDKIRDVESGLKFLDWISLRPYGCPLDGIAYSSLLKLLAKSKAFHEIDSVFVRMKCENEVPTNDAFGVLIRSYSECGLIDKAFEFYTLAVQRYNSVPNVFACNSLLNGLVKNDRMETAHQVYDEMLQRNNSVGTECCADNYSTCIMVSAFCKKGKVEAARKKAFLLFEELKLKGFLPAVETYGAIINGLSKEGNFSLVDKLMHEMKARGLVINVQVYNTMIDAQCRHGSKTKAVEILENMIEIGCGPDIITYNILICDSCRHGKVKEAEELVEHAARRGLRPNKLTYTPLLNAYCRQNDTNKALDLFVKMVNNGEKPDLLAYNSLIHGIVGLGEIETAIIILEKMTEREVFPDAGVYNVLINGLCKKGKLAAANNLLSKMLDQNIPPDKFIYATLIDGFIRHQEINKARKLFELAVQKGKNLDVIVYNAMIKGYCKNGNLDEAVSCVKKMIRSHISPDEFTYSTIIDGYAKHHDINGALVMFNRMVKQNCKPNVVTYTSLIYGFCQRGDDLGAEKLSETKGIRDCPVVFAALLYGICLEGKAKEWNTMISCSMNESELLVAVKYMSIFNQYAPQGSISEASLILQMLIDDVRSKHQVSVN